jgi:2-hydroxychromene-2-carboxylate isomerase
MKPIDAPEQPLPLRDSISHGKPVLFYFDFISPYSYLASQLIAQRSDLGAISFLHRPVVFGSMLAKRNAVGPGEIPSRRRIGLVDALLLAERYGIPFEGPPAHPFNSIYALRSVCAVEDEAAKHRLMQLYFRAAWAQGETLEDLAVLSRCLREAGIDQDPEEAATDRRWRSALKDNTNDALDRGAWGVPTFVVDDVLFFGHDRLDLLAAHLEGRVKLDREKLERMLARPQPGRVT